MAIDYTARDYAAVLREAEPAGLDLVIESLESGEATRNAVLLARPDAAVIYLNNEPPDMPEIAAKGLRSLFPHHRADGAMLADLVKLFERGVIPLPRLEVMPLEQAAEAHRKLEQWRTLGKMVLHVQDIRGIPGSRAACRSADCPAQVPRGRNAGVPHGAFRPAR